MEEYQQAGYEEDPSTLMTKIQVISELLGQYQNVSGYQAYLESIQTQYEQMKDSSFYEGRPYAEAQAKKTTEDSGKSYRDRNPGNWYELAWGADGGTNHQKFLFYWRSVFVLFWYLRIAHTICLGCLEAVDVDMAV